MLYKSADWKSWSCDTKEIGLGERKFEPRVPRMPFVFIAFDKVPPSHKMLRNVVDAWANNTERNIVPRHATIVFLVQLVLVPLRELAVLLGLEFFGET
jgi:hypothetical protein